MHISQHIQISGMPASGNPLRVGLSQATAVVKERPLARIILVEGVPRVAFGGRSVLAREVVLDRRLPRY